MHPVFVWLLLFCGLALVVGPARAQSPTASNSDGNGVLTVIVEGVEDALRDNVLATLDINRFAGQAAPDEIRLRWLHGRAEREIRAALEPFGYYAPTIEAALNRTPEGWEARYRIQPGEPIRIAVLDVRVLGEGQQDSAFQRVLDRLPLTEGQPLNHVEYEQIKQTLETLAIEHGYFDARFTERAIRIDLQAYQAAVHLHYDTGQRYRFGDVTFKQNILSPELLARFPRFQPGDPYTTSDLLRLQSNLFASPYFAQVQISAPPDAASGTAPVEVELEPNKQRRYSFGLGFGTDTGIRGRTSTVEQRWINRQGHHYEAELLGSQIQSRLGFRYMIPGRDPTTDEYALTAGYIWQDYEQQEFERITLGGSWQQQDGKWLKNYNLNYQYEEFSVGDVPTESSLLLIPGLNWTWVDADDRLHTTRGLLFGFELRGASTALLSDITFVQGALRLKGVYSPNENSRIIARADAGTTFIREDFEQLPASLRFFTGGDASVRGYAFNRIGPTDADGVVVGGKNQLVGSLEYEHRVWNDWSLAAFVDSGDAFDGASPDLKTGVGLGLRWRSPVGPVRIDFASGLDRPPGDIFRFSFSIGPDL
ncbi:MAG: autotransporter assembly complex family protein [Candidatus Competibacteraceae bacterium]|nr:autotransporter assembly complex family protein [Candidatus Competibacteraceae bacterium]